MIEIVTLPPEIALARSNDSIRHRSNGEGLAEIRVPLEIPSEIKKRSKEPTSIPDA